MNRLARSLAVITLTALPVLGVVPGTTGPAAAQGRVASCNTAFAVANALPKPVWRLHLRRTGNASWGADLLGSGILMPGEVVALRPGHGLHDLLAVDRDGGRHVLMAKDPCALTLVRIQA